MIFHSYEYILFLLTVLLVYWALPRREQNLLLLAASYLFYGWVHAWFLWLILCSTVTDYLCGLGMARYPQKKKALLLVSLAMNLGLLGLFKYFGFFVENVIAILEILGLPTFSNTLHILLPVGISFYTFQTLSYTIDIYRGTLKPRRNLLDFALFVAFFPQLVAGPIERAKRLLPQIEQNRTLSPAAARDATFLILWGFFKKLVIADNVARYANEAFLLEQPSFYLIWAGVFAFSIQIFADFSAYTDIARGSARLLGFQLMPNFNHPYMARSPADFWKRWHMSLSYWIRDYVYIPLGGSRGGAIRNSTALLVTFLLCGLWHGASWNYVIWGAYHGVLILSFRLVGGLLPDSLSKIRLLTPLRILFMFILTNIGWMIFREVDAFYLIRYLTTSPFGVSDFELHAGLFIFYKTFLFSLPIWIHALYARLRGPLFGNRSRPVVAINLLASMVMILGMLTLKHAQAFDFIYFQF
ncbi:MAG: MBOAT family protein [Magnetococcales bacterium]|nr:MBOAT family protein [Magnetococcales bacterium]